MTKKMRTSWAQEKCGYCDDDQVVAELVDENNLECEDDKKIEG